MIDGKRYFIKVVGKTKKEHMKNEIKTLQELAEIFPMYKDYFVASKEDDTHCAILLRYIEGEDLKYLLDTNCSYKMIICLYRMLFKKLLFFHETLKYAIIITKCSFLSYNFIQKNVTAKV